MNIARFQLPRVPTLHEINPIVYDVHSNRVTFDGRAPLVAVSLGSRDDGTLICEDPKFVELSKYLKQITGLGGSDSADEDSETEWCKSGSINMENWSDIYDKYGLFVEIPQRLLYWSGLLNTERNLCVLEYARDSPYPFQWNLISIHFLDHVGPTGRQFEILENLNEILDRPGMPGSLHAYKLAEGN